ncbi:MAG: ArnT family glycosyltransferase [Sphingomonadaceae bacterium]
MSPLASPDHDTALPRAKGRTDRWIAWLGFTSIALAFAAFLRVTLYGRVGLMDAGPKGLLLPVAVLVFLMLWFALAMRLLGSAKTGWIVVSFLPLLATLPITVGVIGSEAFAREYWIDRSLKVELLIGLPMLVLACQAGFWGWVRYRCSWRSTGPLVGVLALGLALRWAGMGWGLPFAYQPEETSIYFRLANEVALGGKWNPYYFQNPSLFIYLLGVEFIGVYAVCRALLFGQTPSDLYMVFRGEQELFYSVGRLNSVLLGAATVYLVYLVGRRMWGRRVGLVAGALLAVNFLHVRNSQYGVNDVPSAFFVVAAVYFAVRLAENGAWRHYALAGLMAGLAASTKYNAGAVVVAIAAAHLVRYAGLRNCCGGGALARLGLSAATSLVGFVVGTPYAVLDFDTFLAGFASQFQIGQSAWSGQAPVPTAWLFLTGAAHGAGLAVSLLAVLGMAILLLRHRRDALLLLSFPLVYFAFMSAMELFFVRWVVPVTPFVSLFAALGLDRLARLAPKSRRQLAVWLLLVVAMLQPALFSLRLDWLAHQTDTREEANRWAELSIPEGSKVAIEAFSLLDQESLSFRPTLQHREVELFWRATMHDLEYYRQNGFDYLAVSSFLYDRAFADPDAYSDRVEFYQRLDRELPLVATFSPRGDGQPVPFDLDDLDTPFWHLFAYDRPGPTIKVYRLDG